MSTRRTTGLALLVLTLLALALRLRGIDHGLPMVVEQDCKIPHQVELLRAGGEQWKSDPQFDWYPLFVAYVAELWPAPEPAAPDAPLAEHLAAAARPHSQVRWTVALLAILLVPATFLLAKRFVEPGWALAAAAFVAFSLLHQSFSQQSRPHAVSGATFLAVVLAALAVRNAGRWWHYLGALAALAFALGTLQSGALCVLPILTAQWLRRGGARGSKRILAVSALALAILAALAAAMLLFYPSLIWGEAPEVARKHAQLEFDTATWTLYLGGHEIFLREFAGGGARTVAWTLWSYEPILLALALGAAFAWFATRSRRRALETTESVELRRDAWVLASFVLPYALVLLLYERTYERFLIPLLPYFALAAAYALRELAQWGSAALPSLRKPHGHAALVSTFLALPAVGTWCLASIRAAPHTTTLAARWLERNAGPSTEVALTSTIDLPLCRDPAGFPTWLGPVERALAWPWSAYQASLPAGHGPPPLWKLRTWRPKLIQMTQAPGDYVREQGGEIVVADVFADNRTHAAGTLVRNELLAHARLLARISPDRDPQDYDHPLGYQDESSVPAPHFLWRVLRARCTGPVIEIHALAKP